MELRLSAIRTDGGTQPRALIDSDVIDAYCSAMETGAEFPPVDVFFDGTSYWLADGFHRVRAALDTGRDVITATVHQGTVEDAQWFSFAANQKNGLYRSNADKQRAVKAALEHPKSRGLSDNQIAKHVGVHHETVREWRARIESSCGFRKIEPRTVTRNGTTYQMSTANIGKSKDLPEREAQHQLREHLVVPAATLACVEPEPDEDFSAEPFVRAIEKLVTTFSDEQSLIKQALTKSQRRRVLDGYELLNFIVG